MNFYMGWLYSRESSVSMRRALQYQGSHLLLTMNSSADEKIQVFIHDKNEFPLCSNYINTVDLPDVSKVAYLKIRKVEKRKNCESAQDYSFSRCLENFLIEVKRYF